MMTRTLDDWSQVEALAPEWNELLRQSRSDTFFLSWEWLSSWIDLVKDRVDPFFIVVRDDSGRLLGVAPFYRSKLHLLQAVGFKTLRIAADYSTGFEYGDWIAHKDHEAETIAAIVAALLAQKRAWDVIWMPLVRGWTGGYERILEAAHAGGLLLHKRRKPFGTFPLADTLEAFENTFSSKRRQQLRRHRRNLFADGRVSVIRCEGEATLPQFLEALYDLHARRRLLENDPGTFVRKPLQKKFYAAFAQKALAMGWLRFYALEHDGKIEAIQIGYVYNGVFHQVQEGFNPEYTDGAGNVLRHVVIEECIKEGVKEYDFLGGYTEHKRRWGAIERDGYDLFVAHPSLKNRLLFSKEIWPNGRYMSASGLVDSV